MRGAARRGRGRPPLPRRDRRRLRGADGRPRRGRTASRSSSRASSSRAGPGSSSPATRAMPSVHGRGVARRAAAKPSSPALVRPRRDLMDRATGEARVRVHRRPGRRAGRRTTCARSPTWRGERRRLFGEPQDVEWAIGADGPVLLQSRPITVDSAAARDPRIERLTRANVGEVLPDPVTPLTVSHAGGRARARLRGGRCGGPGSARRARRPSSSSTASGCT